MNKSTKLVTTALVIKVMIGKGIYKILFRKTKHVTPKTNKRTHKPHKQKQPQANKNQTKQKPTTTKPMQFSKFH